MATAQVPAALEWTKARKEEKKKVKSAIVYVYVYGTLGFLGVYNYSSRFE